MGGGPKQLLGSMVSSLSCLMQHCEFDPPLRRIFPLELMVTYAKISPQMVKPRDKAGEHRSKRSQGVIITSNVQVLP